MLFASRLALRFRRLRKQVARHATVVIPMTQIAESDNVLLQITQPSGVVDNLQAVPGNQRRCQFRGQGASTTILFVVSSATDPVAVVDPSTNQVITQEIPVRKSPIRLAVTPDARKAYVSNSSEL